MMMSARRPQCPLPCYGSDYDKLWIRTQGEQGPGIGTARFEAREQR